jgi:ABC-type sulfate/molybdate transport systems ATPase subunit
VPGAHRADGLEIRLRSRLREFDLDVTLDAGPAGRLAVLGPSGSGKSTILRMVAGLLRPDHGLIRLGGNVLFDDRSGSDLAPEQRRVGYVPQDPTLFPHLDAAGNVAYAIRGGRRAGKRARAVELLDLFGLAGMASVRPAEMSGGEAKRVSLARAIATGPSLYLLDEPLASLDGHTHQKTLAALAGVLDSAGVPVLLVTHSPAEAAQLTDLSLHLDRGRLSNDSKSTKEEQKWNQSSGSATSRKRPVSIRRTMKR